MALLTAAELPARISESVLEVAWETLCIRLDHIPQYGLVYGRAESQGFVPSSLPVSVLPLSPEPQRHTHRADSGGADGRRATCANQRLYVNQLVLLVYQFVLYVYQCVLYIYQFAIPVGQTVALLTAAELPARISDSVLFVYGIRGPEGLLFGRPLV